MQRQIYRVKAGDFKRLKVTMEELAPPGADEVLVEIKTIGLNFADIFAIWGLYSATPKEPFVPGLEYSGVVRKVGSHVQELKEGDEIMGVTKFGAYATHLNIDARYVVPIPPGWSFDEGASYLVQILTAYYALFSLGNLSEGQVVLIHSGAGGVGLLANRLANKVGAITIGTTGSAAKCDLMLSEGYDGVIVRDRHFKMKLERELAGRDLHLVLECIGGRILKDSFDMLAAEGRMVVYGSAHFTAPTDRPNYLKLLFHYLRRPRIDPLSLPNTNRSIMGFNLIWLYDRVELLHQILQDVQEFALPPPMVGHTYSFDKLPDALRALRNGKTMGKVVVRVKI